MNTNTVENVLISKDTIFLQTYLKYLEIEKKNSLRDRKCEISEQKYREDNTECDKKDKLNSDSDEEAKKVRKL